jgi:hypothetical protein
MAATLSTPSTSRQPNNNIRCMITTTHLETSHQRLLPRRRNSYRVRLQDHDNITGAIHSHPQTQNNNGHIAAMAGHHRLFQSEGQCVRRHMPTRDDAFWRTVVRDMHLNDRETWRASPSDHVLFNQYFEMIAFERYVSVEGEALDWPKAEKIVATVHTATYNHRFFVTEKGYFGV